MATDAPASATPPAMRYSAFISYNHRDQMHARWLHRMLEGYRLPKHLRDAETPLGVIGARLPPVFRDRDELAASTDLAQSVRDALLVSHALIVICSPNSAASRWVNEEIRTFIALGRRDRIISLVVDGQPGSRDPASDSFPPALFEGVDTEPLAADLRKAADGPNDAKLKVIAALLAVPFDELRQREAARRQRRLMLVASVSGVLALAMSGLAVLALVSRNEAIEQRDLARQRSITAQRTVDFVKSMFSVSDPSEARGATITAREILDRGAERIDRGLEREPAVRAELGVTLGEVYGSLGLYQKSDAILRRTLKIAHGDAAIGARQQIALGDSNFRLGDYDQAIAAYTRAIALARQTDDGQSRALPTALAGLGQALTAIGETDRATAVLDEAIALDRARFGPTSSDLARDLEATGLNHFEAGDRARARPLIARALAIRRTLEGELSPSVSDNLNTLATIALLDGDLATAERLYRQNIAVDEKVLGPQHPDFAGSLNNLGRVLIDRRKFAEAAPLLERARAIEAAQRDEAHDDFALVLWNLGLARLGLGDAAGAKAMLDRALATARPMHHRSEAPIMADLAGLRCRADDVAGGMALLAAARPLMARTYPNDPWRTAWVDTVRGGCLLRAGDRAQARALLASSVPIVRKRWAADTLYGRAATLLLRDAQSDGAG